MNIYLKDVIDFENNGLGFLTDALISNVTESLNGDYILEFEYPVNGKLSEYLVENNVVKSKVSNGTYQLFDIKKITTTFDTIKVYCQHITYRLLDNFLLDTFPKNLNCGAFGQWILEHTNYSHPFTFYSDINNYASARYVRKNPIEAILGSEDNSMINLFNGELERDNFNIKMLANRGSNNHVKLLVGKNIKSIKIVTDITSIFTRILPLGFDGLMLPEIYVDSPIINDYPRPKIGKIEFGNIKYDPTGEDPEAYADIEDAYTALRLAVKDLYRQGVDKPSINIKIDWLELSKINDYYKLYRNLEKVRLGDVITAQILGLDYTTKVTKVVYNVLTDTIDKFEIGTLTNTIAKTLNNQTKEIENINPTSILKSATDRATYLINNAMGGYVLKTNNELFIMDSDKTDLANRIWRWNINGLGYSNTGINGPYGTAITQDGAINADFITAGKINTNLIEGYDSLVLKVGSQDGRIAQISTSLDEINAKIQDIADITTSGESTFASVELLNVAMSDPIFFKIRPIEENISYVYSHPNLFSSNKLFSKTRTIRFENTKTHEYFDYVLPDNLLYYDENTYDEFIFDYENTTCYVNKRCKYLADGSVAKLDEEVTNYYALPDIPLTDGNYKIDILGYKTGYISVRLLANNIYTATYATKVEVKSELSLTYDRITEEVKANYTTKGEYNELSAKQTILADSVTTEVARAKGEEEKLSTRIKNTATKIELIAKDNKTSVGLTIKLRNEDGTELDSETENITFSGMVKFEDLEKTGSTIINGSNITTGTINGSLVNVTNINASNIKTGTLKSTEIDNGAFKVSSAGAMECSNATITGGSVKLYGDNNANPRFQIFASNNNSNYVSYFPTGTRFYKDDSGVIEIVTYLTTPYIAVGNINTIGNVATMTPYGVSTNSDITLKSNITNIEENKSFNIINNLNPIEYTFKDGKNYHRGLSAQEVEKVLKNNDINNEIYSIDENGIYSLNYTEFIPDLINCIKYLNKKVEELANEKNS